MGASVASRRRIVVVSSIAYFLRFVALGAFFPYLFLWLDATGHERRCAQAQSQIDICHSGGPTYLR